MTQGDNANLTEKASVKLGVETKTLLVLIETKYKTKTKYNVSFAFLLKFISVGSWRTNLSQVNDLNE